MADVPGLSLAGFTAWLAVAHPELVADPLTVSLIPGGKSNLTYRIDGARIPMVLRRPPLGHVLSSAHDMRREHRVISALRGSAVPVPAVVDIVDDSEARVTGTPFFVMELVEGRVLSRRSDNVDYTPDALRHISIELATTLADLHEIDPETVGLGDFGRVDGYLARQLSTWRRQYDASRSRHLPALDALQAALGDEVPESARGAIVHGDYRLDNVLVADVERPRIAAILDWEMATLGDPLVDLGLFGLYWNLADVAPGLAALSSAVDPEAGYPEFTELVDAYAERAGIPTPDLRWYRAFAAYKLAVIAEGIHRRFTAGETVGEGFDRLGDLVEPLGRDGLARLAAGGQ